VKTSQLLTCCLGLAVLVTVGSSRAYAQFEIDPDHYETREAEPVPQAKTNVPQVAIHYQGNVTLPYSVQCSRSNLLPGKYSIAVDSERGKTVRVTMRRQGHTVRFEGITQRQSPNHTRNVLVVQHNGAAHQLSLIQVAQLDVIFSPTQGFERAANGKPSNLQELPLILANSRR
jgi:hypothetical protein